MTGPCRASPVHRSFGRAASNRPNAGGGAPSGRVRSSRRTKWRCRVRSAGDHPPLVRKIRATCAAVRAGFSRFSAAARARTSAGVRRVTWRAGGISASNPPARQARIHRSRLGRDTLHRLAERPGMRAGGQLTDQPAPLAGSQPRIGCLPDQRVPEQRDSTGSLARGGPAHHLQRSWATSRTRQRGLILLRTPCRPASAPPSPGWC